MVLTISDDEDVDNNSHYFCDEEDDGNECFTHLRKLSTSVTAKCCVSWLTDTETALSAAIAGPQGRPRDAVSVHLETCRGMG